MKKAFAVLLALLLVLACAAASASGDGKAGVGTAEPVLFRSDLGFSFLYDVRMLRVTACTGPSGPFVLLAANGAEDAALTLLPPETCGMLPWKYLELRAHPQDSYRYEGLAEGTLVHFSHPSEELPGCRAAYYALDGSGSFLVAFAHYPEGSSEKWETLFGDVLRSVSFVTPEALRADWMPQDYAGSRVPSGGDAWVLFTALEPLDGVTLLTLSAGIDSDGDLLLASTDTRYIGTLPAGGSFAAGLEFPGDLPYNGISWTDADGTVRRFTVDISGEDGSLLLTAF